MRSLPIFRCPPEPQPAPATITYRLTCPIVDQRYGFLSLQAEARAQLLDNLDAEGWEQAGPIIYDRLAAEFVATVPVRPRIDPDDARPWETREAYAADMFDTLAA